MYINSTYSQFYLFLALAANAANNPLTKTNPDLDEERKQRQQLWNGGKNTLNFIFIADLLLLPSETTLIWQVFIFIIINSNFISLFDR